LRQWCTRTHNRNWILSRTRNQCSSRRSGVMCSDFLAENTKRENTEKTSQVRELHKLRSKCNCNCGLSRLRNKPSNFYKISSVLNKIYAKKIIWTQCTKQCYWQNANHHLQQLFCWYASCSNQMQQIQPQLWRRQTRRWRIIAWNGTPDAVHQCPQVNCSTSIVETRQDNIICWQ